MSVVEIFIAYSHNDLRHKEEFKKFLRPLLNTGRARVWDDYDIEAGKDWEAEIKKRLYGADIIILLVSPDSLASDYFYGNEVSVSLERHNKGEAVVIPIILRPCAWTLTPLGNLEALPEKGKPITKYELQDEAFTEIAHKMDATIQELSSIRRMATERENQYRVFEAVAHTAEHLFHKGEWSTAKTSYLEAIQLHQSGFSPSGDVMRQQVAECERQEGQLLVRQAFEARLAEFVANIQDAERLYKNENWREARTIYGDLFKKHETGFPGEVSEFRRRQLECEQGVQEQERIAREEKQKQDSYEKQLQDGFHLMRKREYYRVLQAARTALAIMPDSIDALNLISDAEAGIERLPEEQRIARKRTTIIFSATTIILLAIGLVSWQVIRKMEADRTHAAFNYALEDNKLHTWRSFVKEFPLHENVDQAKDSIKIIETRINKLIELADYYLKDVDDPTFASDRHNLLNDARTTLELILKVDSTNSPMKRKLDNIPEK